MDTQALAFDTGVRGLNWKAFIADDRYKLWHTRHVLDACPEFLANPAVRRVALSVVPFIKCEVSNGREPHAEANLTAAGWTKLEPAQLLTVACQSFDASVPRQIGIQEAFVRRQSRVGFRRPELPAAERGS